MRGFLTVAIAIVLGGCAFSSTTPLAQDTFRVEANTAPICGAAGAQKIAMQQAAAETIRRGYDRFVVIDDKANAHKQYTNIPGFAPSSHGNELVVRMFREGDRSAANALSARETLGPKWKELASKSVMNCLD